IVSPIRSESGSQRGAVLSGHVTSVINGLHGKCPAAGQSDMVISRREPFAVPAGGPAAGSRALPKFLPAAAVRLT
ncbi:MAG: hypothetical protein KDA90_04430, partial [Planctomycetaceae bacterium]|nr:hypothetical protein [Planctomycetaceae bacterium]